jgi:hypothetical protein
VHLYIVSFGEERGDESDNEEDDYEDENDYRARVGLHDPWWEARLSDNEDLFDVDMDGGDGWPRPSTQSSGGGGAGRSTQHSFEGEVVTILMRVMMMTILRLLKWIMMSIMLVCLKVVAVS